MITPADLLALCALIIALMAVLALRSLRRRLQGVEETLEQHTQTLLAIEGTAKVLSGEAVSHREDLARVRRAIDRLSELNQETRLEMRLRDADRSPYTQAIQLIQNGQPRSEVRKLCALTETEVDLLFNLHGQGVSPSLSPDDQRPPDAFR